MNESDGHAATVRGQARDECKGTRVVSVRECAREIRPKFYDMDAARESSPMFFGVVIITIVHLRLLALTGIEGESFTRWP